MMLATSLFIGLCVFLHKQLALLQLERDPKTKGCSKNKGGGLFGWGLPYSKCSYREVYYLR